jgi:hypothetical protein
MGIAISANGGSGRASRGGSHGVSPATPGSQHMAPRSRAGEGRSPQAGGNARDAIGHTPGARRGHEKATGDDARRLPYA